MTKFGFFMIFLTTTILIFKKVVQSTSISNTIWKVCELCVKNKKFTEDKAIIIETMEATTPELGPVGFCSPKSSSFSGSASIVVEEAARNFQSPRQYKQVGRSEFLCSAW